MSTVKGKSIMNESKAHPITKGMVWRAFKKVRRSKGGVGVDKISLSDYEVDLTSNLYKLWNRMTSGSYFPPPVKEVTIPKRDGGYRKLGIPTVSDRIAQMVVKDYLEAQLEEYFDEQSYGYRPGKSAHDAIASCRANCHRYPWVIDLDIKGFFDHMRHDLLLKALSQHTEEKWVHMYVSRWLKAPVNRAGIDQNREEGTPQGGVISPLLANLYLHYAFDKWLRINYNGIMFERYADDMVIHCMSLSEAETLLRSITERLATCGLTVHPDKTRIVYCKDSRRKGDHTSVSFDFLGYTFKPRNTQGRDGKSFTGFNPGISKSSIKRIVGEIKSLKQIHCFQDIENIAELLNHRIRGWIYYYGKFRRSSLYKLWRWLNDRLVQWVRRRYKRMKQSTMRSVKWLRRIYRQKPLLFVHWYYATP